ncbi:MAG: hypothetical protein Q8L81_07940 [Bacteroidota bacterium]|nr:hypothetical protein [Bacteroidota bacterium]
MISIVTLGLLCFSFFSNAQSLNCGGAFPAIDHSGDKPNWFNQYYFQLTWISHLDFTNKKE